MKLKTFLIVGCLGGLFTLSSCTAPTNVKDYSAYVNPFIGTGGHGHTFPGAVVPHGMIQPSPDTRIDGWDACSGYYYADSTINGFSHTHVSGTGCCDYGDVLLMPTVGKQQYRTTDPQSQRLAYASSFSHKNEIAEPGYYSVFLDTYQVKAEISSTKRGAIHRYTFPENAESGFIIDLDYSLQRQTNSEMEIEVISDTEICGHKKTTYWAFDQYINFYAKFSKPFYLRQTFSSFFAYFSFSNFQYQIFFRTLVLFLCPVYDRFLVNYTPTYLFCYYIVEQHRRKPKIYRI